MNVEKIRGYIKEPREKLLNHKLYTEIKSIDVTNSISIAVEALKQHKSQVEPQRAELYMRKRRERKQGDKISYMDTFRVFRFS